jgi:hypothetical protein
MALRSIHNPTPPHVRVPQLHGGGLYKVSSMLQLLDKQRAEHVNDGTFTLADLLEIHAGTAEGRMSLLLRLAPHLQAEKQEEAIAQAIALGRNNPETQLRNLVELGKQLPEEMHETVLSAAIEIIEKHCPKEAESLKASLRTDSGRSSGNTLNTSG